MTVRVEIVELIREKTRRIGLHEADLLTQALQIVRKELGLPMLTGSRPL